MLPASAASNGNGSAPPAKDERQFQYRFSMDYVRNLPESQRPVERETFGERHVETNVGSL
jgi:CD2 antigen cytoplasmic tail-binding protein 2